MVLRSCHHSHCWFAQQLLTFCKSLHWISLAISLSCSPDSSYTRNGNSSFQAEWKHFSRAELRWTRRPFAEAGEARISAQHKTHNVDVWPLRRPHSDRRFHPAFVTCGQLRTILPWKYVRFSLGLSSQGWRSWGTRVRWGFRYKVRNGLCSYRCYRDLKLCFGISLYYWTFFFSIFLCYFTLSNARPFYLSLSRPVFEVGQGDPWIVCILDKVN